MVGPIGGTLKDVSLFGTGKCSTEPPAPMSFVTTAGRFVPMKSSPGRVRRTAAALGTSCAFGKPPGSGFVPHPAQPLEQPPPPHDATSRKRVSISARRATKRVAKRDARD